MKHLIDLLAPKIGPKATAVLTAGLTLFGQVESRLATSPVGTTIIDLASEAGLMAMLPAPIAAVAGYVARKSTFKSEPSEIDTINERLDKFSHIIDVVNNAQNEGFNEISNRMSDISNEINSLEEDIYKLNMEGDDSNKNNKYNEIDEQINFIKNRIVSISETVSKNSSRINDIKKTESHSSNDVPPTFMASLNTQNRRINDMRVMVNSIKDSHGKMAKDLVITRTTVADHHKRISELESVNVKPKDSHEERAQNSPVKVLSVEETPEERKRIQELSEQARVSSDFYYSKRSLNNLYDPRVHSDLKLLFHELIKSTPFDYVITRGFATQEEQAELMRKRPKVTWTKNSRHLYGLAIDIAAIDENGKITWKMEYYVKIMEEAHRVAERLGIDVDSGAIDWGRDGPHLELSKSTYPDDGSMRIEDPFSFT